MSETANFEFHGSWEFLDMARGFPEYFEVRRFLVKNFLQFQLG